MAEPEGMDVDSPAVPSTSSGSNKKRFEVKKVNVFLNRYFSYLTALCSFLFFFADHFFLFRCSGTLLLCGHGVNCNNVIYFSRELRLPNQIYRQMYRKFDESVDRFLAKLHPSNLVNTIFHLHSINLNKIAIHKLCKIRFSKKLFAIRFPNKHCNF